MSEQSTAIGNATAQFISLARHRNFAPDVMDMAKMCLVDYVGVALGLNGYRAMESDFTKERVADPALRELLPKVELEVQPDMHLNTGFVDVFLADGRQLHAETPWALGNPANPMGWNDMQTKFHSLVEPVLGGDWLKLFETLRAFDQPGNLAQVIALTRPPDHSC